MIKKIHPCTGIETTNLLNKNTDKKKQKLQNGKQRKFREILQEILEENNKLGNK